MSQSRFTYHRGHVSPLVLPGAFVELRSSEIEVALHEGKKAAQKYKASDKWHSENKKLSPIFEGNHRWANFTSGFMAQLAVERFIRPGMPTTVSGDDGDYGIDAMSVGGHIVNVKTRFCFHRIDGSPTPMLLTKPRDENPDFLTEWYLHTKTHNNNGLTWAGVWLYGGISLLDFEATHHWFHGPRSRDKAAEPQNLIPFGAFIRRLRDPSPIRLGEVTPYLTSSAPCNCERCEGIISRVG